MFIQPILLGTNDRAVLRQLMHFLRNLLNLQIYPASWRVASLRLH
jgi:hypothetical protein